jgi:predicted metal-dependent hydrolase
MRILSPSDKMFGKNINWIVRIRRRIIRPHRGSAKAYKENKDLARKIAMERLEYFNQFYQYKIGKVFIRNQKSRWGSCSSKGNLNFNYKIALLAPELLDYIIVHELCHLGEMNHSKNFWALVAKTVPDFKERKKKIRLFGVK